MVGVLELNSPPGGSTDLSGVPHVRHPGLVISGITHLSGVPHVRHQGLVRALWRLRKTATVGAGLKNKSKQLGKCN